MCYYLIIIRGLCITTTALSGISVTTIHPAPIFTLLPMVMFPMIFAPAPIKTLFFIVGAPPFSPWLLYLIQLLHVALSYNYLR